MLKLQYHPVRFGFSSALLTMITVISLISRFLRYRSELPVELRHEPAANKTLVTWTSRRLVTSFLHTVAFSALAVASAIIALLPQYGWRTTFRENGLIAWWPNHLEYHPFALALIAINVSVVLYIMSTSLRSSRPTIRLLPYYTITSVTLVATLFLATRWHQKYNDHFDAVHSVSLKPRIERVVAGRKTVVCDYRYYATLGSRRQNDVSRPLFVYTDQTFSSYLRKQKTEVVLTLRSDEHWSRSYANCYRFLSAPESGFFLSELSESTNRHGIFEKKTNNSGYEENWAVPMPSPV